MRRLFAIPLVAAMAACGWPPSIDRVALVASHADYNYEIEIHARVDSYGGPCNPSLFPTRIDERHWIYTNRIEGEVPASDLVLTYERDRTKYPWPQSALQGKITFGEGTMRVELDVPYYKTNDVDHYERYRFNGTYDLRQRKGN